MFRHLLRFVPGLSIVIMVGILFSTGCAVLRRDARIVPLTPAERVLNVESFEYVWSRIRDRHWDRDLNGLDWQAVHDELLPQLMAAETMPAVRRVMRDMIARLGQSHFAIIPSQLYGDIDLATGKRPGPGGTGIGVRVIAGQALVVSVDDGSSADESGIRMGWEIIAVAGTEIPPMLERLGDELAGRTTRDFILARSVLSRMQGKIGESVQVRFRDGADQLVDLELPLERPRGRLTQFGNLPATYVWIETREIDENIGYLAFNVFLDPAHLMKEFNGAMTTYMDADGLIIDLRGNIGGIGVMAMGMAGWLIDQKGLRLGTMHLRETEIKFVVTPRPLTYEGPVAILQDGLSASTAEIMAGGLQDLERVRVFGGVSAGAALPSTVERLPNGDGFQYAVANYVSEGGAVLEGIGVTPDVEIHPSRPALLDGRDLVLDAAVVWIRGQHESS